MMKRWLLITLAFFAGSVLAAPTPLGTATAANDNTTTATVAHTVASGSNVVSYIFLFVNNDVGITSMDTFGGVAPVLVGTYGTALYIYRVVSPAAGATNATANLPSSQIWSIHVLTLQGVDTADPEDALVSNTNNEGTTLPVTVTSSTNDLGVAFGLMIRDNIAAAEGSTLSTANQGIAGGANISTAVVYEAGAASVTLGVSSDLSFGDNLILGFSVNGSGGGASAVPVIYNQLLKSKR